MATLERGVPSLVLRVWLWSLPRDGRSNLSLSRLCRTERHGLPVPRARASGSFDLLRGRIPSYLMSLKEDT